MQNIIPYLGPILFVALVYFFVVINALPFWKKHREFRKNHEKTQCEVCERTIINRRELAAIPLWPFGWRLLHRECIKNERRNVASKGIFPLRGYSMTQIGNYEINTVGGFFSRISSPVIGIILVYLFKPKIPDGVLAALYALAIISILRLTITRILVYKKIEQGLPQ